MSALHSGSATARTKVEHLGAERYQVTFTLQAPPGTNTVHLAGSFNGWSTSATQMTGPDDQRSYTVALELARGRYEYKYVLDGRHWLADPDNPIKSRAPMRTRCCSWESSRRRRAQVKVLPHPR